MDDALDEVGALIERGRRLGRSHQIATVNVDFIVNALDDPAALETLQQTDLNLNDGMPLVWASRALGMPQRERVAGSDLVPALAERAAQQGWSIHFFGSGPGVGERAAKMLRERNPGLVISAEAVPRMSDVNELDDAVLDEIAEIDADILCVALGNPKQERFIAAHRERLRTPVMVGIGGSLEMLVGDRRRAPVWAQRAGVEWLFRALQEPRRLGRRYARDAFVFGPQLVRHARKIRAARDDARLALSIDDVVRLAPATPGVAEVPWVEAYTAVAAGVALEIDVRGLERLDSQSASRIVGLRRAAARSGAEWTIEHVDIALSEYAIATQSVYWLRDSERGPQRHAEG